MGRVVVDSDVKRGIPPGQKLQINPSHLSYPTRGEVSQGLVGAELATGAPGVSGWLVICLGVLHQ
jgi:hypothetical protein